jgi:hypothetical protein
MIPPLDALEMYIFAFVGGFVIAFLLLAAKFAAWRAAAHGKMALEAMKWRDQALSHEAEYQRFKKTLEELEVKVRGSN